MVCMLGVARRWRRDQTMDARLTEDIACIMIAQTEQANQFEWTFGVNIGVDRIHNHW